MVNYIDFEWIETLSAQDKEQGTTLATKIIKLQEETGELAAAYLASIGSNNVSASAMTLNPQESVLEEAIDCMLVVADIINNITEDPALAGICETMAERKLSKWQNKIKAIEKLNSQKGV